MSGLLERIARRRRASASSRPGLPPAEPATGASAPEPEVNGHSNGHAANGAHLNGHVVAALNGRAALEPAQDQEAATAVETPPAPPDPAEPDRVVTGDGGVTVDRGVTVDGIAAAEAVTTSHDVVAGDEPSTSDTPGAAATSAPAAEATEPAEPAPASASSGSRPGLAERGRIRRRVRFLQALRELQLRDLGGFILELHRFGVERPELVEAKLAGATLVDAELRALERALREGLPLGEIRAPGIGGACESCGAVHGSTDRFCATCGSALTGGSTAESPSAAETPSPDSTERTPTEPDALDDEA